MAASIFISFAGRDLKTATAVCEALEGRGFSCWLSQRDVQAGDSFQVSIVRAIRAARAMVLVFTQHSNHSEEVAKELALASQSRVRVVPLRMEAVTPNEAFAYEFATRQWIDFAAGWDKGLEQLCQRLTVLLADETAGEAPPPPTAPAPAARRRSGRWPLVLGVLVLALAAAGAAYVATRPPPQRPAVAAPPPAAAPAKPAAGSDIPY